MFQLASMSSLVLILSLVAFCSHTHVTATYLEMPDGTEKDMIIYQKYVELDKDTKKIVGNVIKSMLPFIMEANENLNISSICSSQLFQLVSGIKKLQVPYLKILDASGKPPSGLMTGTFHMLGDYDECIKTSVLRKDGKVAFKGQYCLVNVRPVLPKKRGVLKLNNHLEELLEYTKNTSEALRFFLSTVHTFYENAAKYGMCIPSGCSPEDLNRMLHYFAERSLINATVRFCNLQDDEKPFAPAMIVSICAFSVLGVLTFLGSFLDYYSMKKEKTFQSAIARSLLCFSVLTNFPKLISTKISDTSLSCLFGIRSLSLFYVILLHQIFAEVRVQNQGHYFRNKDDIESFTMQIVINGFLTVDTFYFLGGLVHSYTRLKYHQKGNREPSILKVIIHRLWRIYPAYIFAMLVSFLFFHMNGPMSTYFYQEFGAKCESGWWKNMLFINNFFSSADACMPHSWYIAADVHLFLISVFTLPVLLKSGKKGTILHMGVIAIGLITTTLWVWHKGVMPSLILNRISEEGILKLSNAYATTFPHIAPYFTGIIVGHILYRWKDLKISTTAQIIGWPVAAACFISMLFMTQKWNLGADFTRTESALYFSFSRFLFVLAVAWMVVCCCRGYGGIINYILSLKIWVPIARISFMMYLISPLLQIQYHARSRMLFDNDRMSRIWRYVGDLGISGLMSLALVVLIESPFISLEKILFHKKSKTEKKDAENNIEVPHKNNEDTFSKEIELENNLKIISIKL